MEPVGEGDESEEASSLVTWSTFCTGYGFGLLGEQPWDAMVCSWRRLEEKVLVSGDSDGLRCCISLNASSGLLGSGEGAPPSSAGEQLGVSVEKWLYTLGWMLK